MCSPRLLRDPAGVGRLEAGHHLEQRGLAVAVAADDADPLARRRRRGETSVSSGRTP